MLYRHSLYPDYVLRESVDRSIVRQLALRDPRLRFVIQGGALVHALGNGNGRRRRHGNSSYELDSSGLHCRARHNWSSARQDSSFWGVGYGTIRAKKVGGMVLAAGGGLFYGCGGVWSTRPTPLVVL